jgi:hypothetical protein
VGLRHAARLADVAQNAAALSGLAVLKRFASWPVCRFASYLNNSAISELPDGLTVERRVVMPGKIMQRVKKLVTLSFAVSFLLSAPASAQPRDVIEVSFYKIKGGYKAEWLALYKKNHLPILQDHQKAGLIQSIEINEISFHHAEPAWDYQVVMRMKNWAAFDEMAKREEEVKKRLYPNQEQFDKEENRRWEIAERHWDEVIRPVKID